MTADRWALLAELLGDAMADEQSPPWTIHCFAQSRSVVEAALAASPDQASLLEASTNESKDPRR
ncbi:MAG: hypothetical protein ACRDWV_10715 [Acidimicrobiales bacterium]